MRAIETRYARSGDVRIAYQVVGQGPFDLVFAPGFISNLELHWEDPGYAHLLRRLSAFARLIQFDKRGTGLSDRVDPRDLPDLRTRMDDLRAVMDAAGSTRAVLLGASEGAPMAILFALTYPERTRSLVLYGGYAHFHDWVMGPEELAAFIGSAEHAWGTGATLPHFAPGRAEDPRFRAWWARFERLSASPSTAIALARMNALIDVREVLPKLRVPALVICREEDVRVSPAASRYLAEKIPEAQLVELPGRDHLIWIGDVDRVLDAIEGFLTGGSSSRCADRVLAAVLTARIVGQKRLAARGDDRDWRTRFEALRQRFAPTLTRSNATILAAEAGKLIIRFDGPAKAAEAAFLLREEAYALGLPVAQGLHVGEVEIEGDTVTGRALQISAEIASSADAGDILASSIVADLSAGSGLHFAEKGKVLIAGMEMPLRLFGIIAEQHLEPHAKWPKAAGLELLSGREREVLGFVADGLSNPAIATELGLSEHTVKRHVANILLKLDMPSRAAAAALSAREGAG